MIGPGVVTVTLTDRAGNHTVVQVPYTVGQGRTLFWRARARTTSGLTGSWTAPRWFVAAP